MLFKHALTYGKHFSPDGDGGGGGAATNDAGGDGDQSGGDDSGQSGDDDVAGLKSALASERKAAREAVKAARDLQKELDGIKAAKAEAAEAEATEQGKWRELAESRETKLTAATAERDQLQAERDEYRALVDADVKAAWADLPEEVRDAYDGDDDDVLGKKRHMARMAKVIARLTATTAGGSRQNPPANGAKQDKVPSVLPKSRLFN